MTETISPAETQAAGSPRIPRPHTDGAALDRVLAILDNFASKDMPGRQRHIQDCVDQILAKVDSKPAAAAG
jgi:hypothetical protein